MDDGCKPCTVYGRFLYTRCCPEVLDAGEELDEEGEEEELDKEGGSRGGDRGNGA